jgi:hypothetical protein
MALSYTAARTETASGTMAVQIKRTAAVLAFPIYWVTVVKTWFERTGYADKGVSVVTIVDRTRPWGRRLRYVALLLASSLLLAVASFRAADGDLPAVTSVFVLFLLLLVVLASGVIEVVRSLSARGKQPKKAGALKRLNPRWVVGAGAAAGQCRRRIVRETDHQRKNLRRRGGSHGRP